jgi:putative ABC transport system substrate-binding protein
MITRRQLVVVLGASALFAPLAALAQKQAKVWRIGFLYFGSYRSALETGRYAAFLQGMRERGYVEGRDFVVEARYADAKSERYPDLAAELVRLKVDLIVSTATAMHRAVRQATSTIPIVVTASSDPVGEGLAASLARPGGNITGITSNNAELSQKYVELLATAVPKLSRVVVLWNSTEPSHRLQIANVRVAAQKVAGLELVAREVRTIEEFERVVAAAEPDRVDAAIIFFHPFVVQQARRVAELMLKYRLPSIHANRVLTEAGGLMSYSPSIEDNYRRAAYYVDRILNGAKPGDLPIEQPTRFYLVINRKTAKALGLTIPQELLLRADKVIG